MEALKVGHGFDNQAQMGPVINEKQRQRILSYLQRGQAEGAEPLLPGGACTVPNCEGGFYVKPALLGGSLDNVAAREEIFGPVAYVTRFRDEAEGIELANATAYGLANSVWSADLERCNRVAHAMVAGTSWINVHNTFPMGVPFAGVNLSGLGGGTNSAQAFYDYLRDLAVARPYG
jgi:aldehyde dehydrogenase (NAD+)